MQQHYPNQKTKRFHTPAYKKRVNEARRYKRRQSVIPAEKSLFRRSLVYLIPLVVVVAGLVYLAYFAPFLKIQSLSVQGADATLTSQIQSSFDADLSSYVHGLPQRNILFFSKARFSSEISSNALVSKVTYLKKDYWHGLTITVVQRVPAYVLQTPSAAFVIANDGVNSAALASGDPLPNGLPIISDAASDAPAIGSAVLSPQKIAYIQAVASGLPSIAQTGVQSYQVSSIDSDFITIVTQAGYRILFDATSDGPTDLQHLKQIIAAQGSLAHTAYIDMRFNPRVYVCAVGQPCATTVPTAQVPTAEAPAAQAPAAPNDPSVPTAPPVPASTQPTTPQS